MEPAAISISTKARRLLRLRRLGRKLALAAGLLAAAAALGEGFALWQLAGRVARLEAAVGLPAVSAVSGAALPADAALPSADSAAQGAQADPAAGMAAQAGSGQAAFSENAPSPSPTAEILAVGSYTALCPALCASPLPARAPAAKTVYLTFDDGPSAHTAAILDTLAQYNVKGTWFLVGTQLSGREDLVRRMDAEGHTVALHSDTHEYADIYASPAAFLEDLGALADKLSAITGTVPGLVRFAGGSINHYDADLYPALTAEVLRRGLRYYDWNVSAQDAVSHSPAPGVIAQRVIRGVEGVSADTPAVVLMHDSKATTPAALPEILQTLSAEGYSFAALDSSVPMVAFSGTV